MKKFDPNLNMKYPTDEERLARRYVRNNLDAASVGCEIKNPQLYEQKRRQNFVGEVFATMAVCLLYAAIGFIFGIFVWTNYAVGLQ